MLALKVSDCQMYAKSGSVQFGEHLPYLVSGNSGNAKVILLAQHHYCTARN